MLLAFIAVVVHALGYAFGESIYHEDRAGRSGRRYVWYAIPAVLCVLSAGQATYYDSAPAFAELVCVLMVALDLLHTLHLIFRFLPLSPFLPYGAIFACLITALWGEGRRVLGLWLLPGLPPRWVLNCSAWSLAGKVELPKDEAGAEPGYSQALCEIPLVGFASAERVVFYVCLVVILGTTVALAIWAERVSTFSNSMKSLGKMLKSKRRVLIFAVVNAASEEFEFRGIIQQALQYSAGTPLDVWALGPPGQGGTNLSLVPPESDRFAGMEVVEGVAWVGVVANSLLFGLMHYYGGFPDGKMGYLMVFVWGSILCILRWFTGSILPGLLIHIWADALIGQLLVYYRGGKAVGRRKKITRTKRA